MTSMLTLFLTYSLPPEYRTWELFIIDHHDDHEHHDHPMFEELPFNKSTVGTVTAGFVIGGAGLIWFACVFQNRKHGFPQKN